MYGGGTQRVLPITVVLLASIDLAREEALPLDVDPIMTPVGSSAYSNPVFTLLVLVKLNQLPNKPRSHEPTKVTGRN